MRNPYNLRGIPERKLKENLWGYSARITEETSKWNPAVISERISTRIFETIFKRFLKKNPTSFLGEITGVVPGKKK